MKRLLISLAAASLLLLTGCASIGRVTEGADTEKSYTRITQETAKEMMSRDDGHVIVDVRRQDEYNAGHIPGAILIPNEEISTSPPAALPDLNQIVLIYCRSGNRSKQAAQKLFDMGYTNIYEFGGINDWTGEIVTEDQTEKTIWTAAEQPVSIRYDRMWEYSDYAESNDPALIAEIVDAIRGLTVGEPTDYAVEDYTDLLTFVFPDSSTCRLEFEEQNWVADDHARYHVEGLQTLRSLLDILMTEKQADAIKPSAVLVIEANGHTFYADFEDNSSADALKEKLSSGPLEIELHDYGHFEKVGSLPWSLPRNDESITTEPGDVILYQGDQITVYYDENTWNFTRLAKIGSVTREELLEAFGEGNVTVTFWTERSE